MNKNLQVLIDTLTECLPDSSKELINLLPEEQQINAWLILLGKHKRFNNISKKKYIPTNEPGKLLGEAVGYDPLRNEVHFLYIPPKTNVYMSSLKLDLEKKLIPNEYLAEINDIIINNNINSYVSIPNYKQIISRSNCCLETWENYEDPE